MQEPIWKQTEAKRNEFVAQVVEGLPSMKLWVQSSIPKKKKERILNPYTYTPSRMAIIKMFENIKFCLRCE
jgi:hypothetical protein